MKTLWTRIQSVRCRAKWFFGIVLYNGLYNCWWRHSLSSRAFTFCRMSSGFARILAMSASSCIHSTCRANAAGISDFETTRSMNKFSTNTTSTHSEAKHFKCASFFRTKRSWKKNFGQAVTLNRRKEAVEVFQPKASPKLHEREYEAICLVLRHAP